MDLSLYQNDAIRHVLSSVACESWIHKPDSNGGLHRAQNRHLLRYHSVRQTILPDVTQLTSRKELVTAVLHRLQEAVASDDNTLQTTERPKLLKSCQEDCFLEEMKAPAAAREAIFTAWHKQEWLTLCKNKALWAIFTCHLYQFILKSNPYSNENVWHCTNATALCKLIGIMSNHWCTVYLFWLEDVTPLNDEDHSRDWNRFDNDKGKYDTTIT